LFGHSPSRLPKHPLVDTSPEARLRSSLGHSLPDWLKMRSGNVGTVTDGVAYPESSEQVRELLDYAQTCGAAVIPMGGGTSVVGHLTVPEGAQAVLTINMSRLCNLINLDPRPNWPPLAPVCWARIWKPSCAHTATRWGTFRSRLNTPHWVAGW
jgi:FAD/FMN-containing dehydrogenase